jgi:hypothetical protein
MSFGQMVDLSHISYLISQKKSREFKAFEICDLRSEIAFFIPETAAKENQPTGNKLRKAAGSHGPGCA